MLRVALVDGALVPDGRAAISPFDRGLLYGEGVFETMRTYGAGVFSLDEHLARLARSAERVGIALPCSLATLAAEVSAARGAFGEAEAVVRAIVTAGDAGRATRVVLVEPLVTPPAERYRDGFSVVLRRGLSLGIAGAKTTSYLASLLARREAEACGADEALLVDANGDVREGATSNVFAVARGCLVTPPLGVDVLDGVTRRHVLACARELGLPAEERAIATESLRDAEEAFLTSTLREVAPITRVDGIPACGAAPGPITVALHAAFRGRTGARAPAPRA